MTNATSLLPTYATAVLNTASGGLSRKGVAPSSTSVFAETLMINGQFLQATSVATSEEKSALKTEEQTHLITYGGREYRISERATLFTQEMRPDIDLAGKLYVLIAPKDAPSGMVSIENAVGLVQQTLHGQLLAPKGYRLLELAADDGALIADEIAELDFQQQVVTALIERCEMEKIVGAGTLTSEQESEEAPIP